MNRDWKLLQASQQTHKLQMTRSTSEALGAVVGLFNTQVKYLKTSYQDIEQSAEPNYDQNKDVQYMQDKCLRFVPNPSSSLEMTIFQLSFILFMLYCLVLFLATHSKNPLKTAYAFIRGLCIKMARLLVGEGRLRFQKISLKQALAQSQVLLRKNKESPLKYVK